MELAQLRQERLARIEQEHAAGRKVIGYLCIYAPVELIAAAGAIPVRLSHGGHETEVAGTKYIRADACSFCKSCLGGFELDPLYRLVDAVVAVNTCDMMRRLPESIERHFGKPVLQAYLPRTSEPLPHRVAEFRRQLDMLRADLARITGSVPSDTALSGAVEQANRVRAWLRRLDAGRDGDGTAPTESILLESASLAWFLGPSVPLPSIPSPLKGEGNGEGEREMENLTGGVTKRPRLMLAGSMLSDDDHWLVRLIEERADIVADALCTGSRSFAEDVPATPDPLDGLARFYYSRVPCMTRRPNDALFDYMKQLAAERRVQGLVYKTLLYCDPYSFEAQRLKRALGLPFLHLDTDYAHENRAQVRTRVEAFLELL